MNAPARVLKALVPPVIRAPRLADSIGRWAAHLVLAFRAGPPHGCPPNGAPCHRPRQPRDLPSGFAPRTDRVWLSSAMTQVIRCLRYLDQLLSWRANRRASGTAPR